MYVYTFSYNGVTTYLVWNLSCRLVWIFMGSDFCKSPQIPSPNGSYRSCGRLKTYEASLSASYNYCSSEIYLEVRKFTELRNVWVTGSEFHSNLIDKIINFVVYYRKYFLVKCNSVYIINKAFCLSKTKNTLKYTTVLGK